VQMMCKQLPFDSICTRAAHQRTSQGVETKGMRE
jgi:hypothetical protein